jgi:hypothetical protein
MPPREFVKTNLDKPGKKMNSPPKSSINMGNGKFNEIPMNEDKRKISP